jgi:hypothetical protein
LKWVKTQVPDRIAGVAHALAMVANIEVAEVYAYALFNMLTGGAGQWTGQEYYDLGADCRKALGEEEDQGFGRISFGSHRGK